MIAYGVADIGAARRFYTGTLGFDELSYLAEDDVAVLARGSAKATLTRGDGGEMQAVAQVEVPDVKAEAERLRAAGVDVGVVLELPGTIRLVDVFDPDGNRLQLTQDLE